MKTTLREAGPERLKEFLANVERAGRKTKVLIVEDDEKDLAHVLRMFAQFESTVETFCSKTANIAIEMMNEVEIDLVMLDLNLGGGRRSGLDVLRYARAANLPARFVILTGSFTMDSSEVEAASELQALFAIKKPIRQDQIAAIVNRA